MKEGKKVLILFGKSNIKNKKLFKKDVYRKAYEQLYDLAKENGLDFYRASYQWYDEEKKVFKNAWTFKDSKWKMVKNLKPAVILDKTKASPEVHFFKEKLKKDFKIINNPEFTLFANNKFLVSLIFSDFFKRYYRISNHKEIENLFVKLKAKKLVIKPTYGSGGDDVFIISKKEISKVKISDNMIAQEFVDSSKGIPGLAKGIHDLRLTFVDGKLIYSYIRQPKKGSYLANLDKGGSMAMAPLNKLPKSINPIIRKVQSIFKFYSPNIYTIDFIFDKKGHPWIVEFNTMPGIAFYPDQKKWQDRMYLSLINILKKV